MKSEIVLACAFLLSAISLTMAGTCPGLCQPTSYACSTSYEAGLCPGASNIECCRESTPNCPGQCQEDSLTCSGTYKSGLCPGASNIRCCESSSSGGSGVKGIDVSQLTSESSFSCMKSDGYTFAIVRAYQSTGSPDTNCAKSVANAHAAGMSSVGVYMFPCPKCSASASAQVQQMITSLTNNKVTYDKVWLDIEGSQYWSSSTTTNQNFFDGLVSELKAQIGNSKIGVYTSSSQWEPIMGSSFKGGSSYDLWYAHYDGTESFSDFTSFGGWTKPYMKQYAGDKTLCSSGVDENWRN